MQGSPLASVDPPGGGLQAFQPYHSKHSQHLHMPGPNHHQGGGGLEPGRPLTAAPKAGFGRTNDSETRQLTPNKGSVPATAPPAPHDRAVNPNIIPDPGTGRRVPVVPVYTYQAARHAAHQVVNDSAAHGLAERHALPDAQQRRSARSMTPVVSPMRPPSTSRQGSGLRRSSKHQPAPPDATPDVGLPPNRRAALYAPPAQPPPLKPEPSKPHFAVQRPVRSETALQRQRQAEAKAVQRMQAAGRQQAAFGRTVNGAAPSGRSVSAEKSKRQGTAATGKLRQGPPGGAPLLPPKRVGGAGERGSHATTVQQAGAGNEHKPGSASVSHERRSQRASSADSVGARDNSSSTAVRSVEVPLLGLSRSDSGLQLEALGDSRGNFEETGCSTSNSIRPSSKMNDSGNLGASADVLFPKPPLGVRVSNPRPLSKTHDAPAARGSSRRSSGYGSGASNPPSRRSSGYGSGASNPPSRRSSGYGSDSRPSSRRSSGYGGSNISAGLRLSGHGTSAATEESLRQLAASQGRQPQAFELLKELQGAPGLVR